MHFGPSKCQCTFAVLLLYTVLVLTRHACLTTVKEEEVEDDDEFVEENLSPWPWDGR